MQDMTLTPSPATRARMDALIDALERKVAADRRWAAARDRARAARLAALLGVGQ